VLTRNQILFDRLPKSHLPVLRLVLSLLWETLQHSSINKMTATNLGVVFGPVLLRPKNDAAIDLKKIQQQVFLQAPRSLWLRLLFFISSQVQVVEVLVRRFEELFPPSKKSSPASSSTSPRRVL
jgi:hypothetical protein